MKNNQNTYKVEVWDVMQYLFARFNDHQIRFVIELSGQLDILRLRRAVDRVTDAFPLLRSSFVEGGGTPYWEDAGFTAEHMVHTFVTDNFERDLQKVICTKTDEKTGPQMMWYVFRGRHSDNLCVVINHMLCDGAGFKELLNLLCDTYTKLKSDPDYRPASQMQDRSERQILMAFGWQSRLKIMLQPYGLSRHDDSIVFGLEGDENNPFIVTHQIAKARFQSAKDYAKRYGATVNDILLAAYIRALHQVLPDDTAAIQCVLDLRKFLPGNEAGGICNLTSNLVCDIGKEVGGTLADTLVRVKNVMDAEKKNSSSLHLVQLLDTVFRVFPYAVTQKLILKNYRNPPLAMSNIGIIDDKRLCFDDISVKYAFMTGSVKFNPYLLLSLSTFCDVPTLSVAFHGTEADKLKISQFLESIDTELDGIYRI